MKMGYAGVLLASRVFVFAYHQDSHIRVVDRSMQDCYLKDAVIGSSHYLRGGSAEGRETTLCFQNLTPRLGFVERLQTCRMGKQ